MSSSEPKFFVVGGTVPSVASSYVVRRADTELYAGLRRGEFCYVLNTRQMGKSSLMVRTVARLRAEGLSVAVLDLTAVGQNLTVEQWYFGLAVRIANQLKMDREIIAFWRAHQELGPMQRFIETLRQVVLPIVPNSFVIFIDEVDAVQSLQFPCDEFFAGIRECYNRRTQDPDFYRLTFCLLGVATPSDLIREVRMSPFNIGRRIEIRDFTEEEARPLAEGLSERCRVSGNDAEAMADRILRRVLYWTGGHPYLTQRLCQAVAERLAADALLSRDPRPSPPDSRPPSSALVDPLCESLFLTHTALDTDDNLAFVRNRLLRMDTDIAALLDLYSQIRAGRRVKDDETNALCATLKLSGVVRIEGGLLRVRNRLYDSIFDREWVQAHMPGGELRRQRAAYRRGVFRTASVGGAVVLVTTLLAIMAITRAADARRATELAKRAGRKANEQEQLANSRLSRLDVAVGNRLVEEGDYAQALTPLVEAMHLDASDPERMEVHRLRVNTVLERLPALKHVWFSTAAIRHAEVSPDGRLAVAASEDGRAQVWEIGLGAPLPIVMRHAGPVNYAAFSPDGRRVVTCGDDGMARVWDLITRRALYVLPHRAGIDLPAHVVHASWSRDGKCIVTCCADSATVWDLTGTAPRQLARLWELHRNTKQAAFSADGSRCTVIASNFSAQIYDIKTAQTVAVLGTDGSNKCYVGSHVEYSPDGRHILVAGVFGGMSQKKGACLFDAATGRPERMFQHNDLGTDAHYSANGKRIVTTSDDQTARLWDPATGRPLTPPLRHGARVLSANFSPDGRRILTCTAGGKVYLWNASSGAKITAPLQHAGTVVSACFAGKSRLVLTAGKDGTTRLWDVTTDSKTNVPPITGYASKQNLILGDSRIVLQRCLPVNGDRNQTEVNVWDLRTIHALLPPDHEVGGWRQYKLSGDTKRIVLIGAHGTHRVQVWDVCAAKPLSPILRADGAELSHDGRTLLLADENGTARLMDIDTGATRCTPFRFRNYLQSWATAFSPDDSRIIAVADASIAIVVSAADGRLLTPSMHHANPLIQACFSPNGSSLITYTNRGTIQIWEVGSGLSRSGPHLGTDDRTGLRTDTFFSPDARYVVTTGPFSNQPSLLWDLSGVGRVRQPKRLPYTLNAVFSPDSNLLAMPDVDLRVWSTHTGTPCTPPLDVDAALNCMVFSPDSRCVVTGGVNSTARIWDAHSGRPITAQMAHRNVVTAAAFSAKGRLLVTGCADGAIRCWDAATGEAVTPPLAQDGEIVALEFLHSGPEFVAFSRNETRFWPLPQRRRSMQEFDALALCLSGQRLDANIGMVTVETSKLREAWRTLSGNGANVSQASTR